MIQPVNALSPKVLFRGEPVSSPSVERVNKFKKKVALINAGGLSVGLGAATTAIARSNTSSWKHAGLYGVGAALISMMFLAPGFLYKAGLYTSSSKEKEILTKEKDASRKFLTDMGDMAVIKSTSKNAIKSMPKI